MQTQKCSHTAPDFFSQRLHAASIPFYLIPKVSVWVSSEDCIAVMFLKNLWDNVCFATQYIPGSILSIKGSPSAQHHQFGMFRHSNDSPLVVRDLTCANKTFPTPLYRLACCYQAWWIHGFMFFMPNSHHNRNQSLSGHGAFFILQSSIFGEDMAFLSHLADKSGKQHWLANLLQKFDKLCVLRCPSAHYYFIYLFYSCLTCSPL